MTAVDPENTHRTPSDPADTASQRPASKLGLALMVLSALATFAAGLALWYLALRAAPTCAPTLQGTSYALMAIGFVGVLGYRLWAAARWRKTGRGNPRSRQSGRTGD